MIIGEIRKGAPKADILIINYPAVLPQEGTCTGIGISAEQAQISREVVKRLAGRRITVEVRLIPPSDVKACVKRGKSDALDAEAIYEAVQRRTMR